MKTRIVLLTFAAGSAALSWEILWQHCASLFLGISAVGAAITLAVMMVGMTLGATMMGRLLASPRFRDLARPLRVYAACELAIGTAGLLLVPGFHALEELDQLVYRASSASETAIALAHAVGIVALLGVPAFAMGATLPALRLVALKYGASLARLYGLNTAGAAFGALMLAFVVVPAVGVVSTSQLASLVNFAVALLAFIAPAPGSAPAALDGAAPHGARAAAPDGAAPHAAALDGAAPHSPDHVETSIPTMPALPAAVRTPYLVAFITGLATFTLEVAWFRALRAAFLSETDAFAIMLAVVLVPLAIAAELAPWVARRGIRLEPVLALAGVVVLVSAPLVERFDALVPYPAHYGLRLVAWFVSGALLIGPAVVVIGLPLPMLLDRTRDPRAAGRVYALNTIGAAVGSLGGAWLLLPTLGLARTVWFMGAALVVVAIFLIMRHAATSIGGTRSARALALVFAGAGVSGLVVAVAGESGVGRERIQGAGRSEPMPVLAYREGPDATVSVVERSNDATSVERVGQIGTGASVAAQRATRELVIDGFAATSEDPDAEYMDWMGRLPMLLHEGRPQRALVICYGTGTTSNAVRREDPEALDIVELNESVLEMAPLFAKGEDVLRDPRVQAINMDGRAWLRRTDRVYDVVTLEPMPPNFAGVNNLYSREFYELVASRLAPGGVVAQWVPHHLVTPEHATSIARTFVDVFPDSILWIAPKDMTGILVGRRAPSVPNGSAHVNGVIGSSWPGLQRVSMGDARRPQSDQYVMTKVALNPRMLATYASYGAVITDDNQLLAYGRSRADKHALLANIVEANLKVIEQAQR